MAMSASLQPQRFFNGSLSFSSSNLKFGHRSASIFRFGRDQELSFVTKGRAFRALASPNVSSVKGDPGNEVLMVDPLEAKRLAAKQSKLKIESQEETPNRSN